MFSTVKELALQILFPPKCMSCDIYVSKMGSICGECFMQMKILSAPECSSCGEPFAYDVSYGEAVHCDICLTHQPQFNCAKALWAYDDLSSKIIKRFKFADKSELAPYLAALLKMRGVDLINKSDLIAPVPLHAKRLRLRRYNQAAMLCKYLGFNNKIAINLLQRTKHTKPQTDLPFAKRQENVQGVFALNPQYKQLIAGKNILLIDDVLTTGATVNACAKLLKENGANEVYVLTVTKRLLEK
jgi:ComF family protein